MSTALLLEVDDLPPCSAEQVLTVTGRAQADLEIAEITWSVNGGPEQVACAPCGENPEFGFDATLEPCLNTIRVTARDVAGHEARVTSFTRYSGESIVMQGCEDRTVERAYGDDGAVVEFDVTATDACDESVPVDCDPPSGSFFPDGETTVTCVAEDGCGTRGECTFVVTVTEPTSPPPVADAGPDRSACGDGRVRIGGSPTATSGVPPYTYSWMPVAGLDDPTSSNPIVTVTGAATYVVTVTDSVGGTDTDEMSLALLPVTPTAAFTAPGPLCEGQAGCFVNTSADATSYEWEFGTAAGDASAEPEPCFAFPAVGTYTVTLTAINACGRSSVSHEVQVAPRPVANFLADEGNGNGGGCVGRPVDFTDLSTENPTSWQWDFDDGSTSTEAEPIARVPQRDGVFIVSAGGLQ